MGIIVMENLGVAVTLGTATTWVRQQYGAQAGQPVMSQERLLQT